MDVDVDVDVDVEGNGAVRVGRGPRSIDISILCLIVVPPGRHPLAPVHRKAESHGLSRSVVGILPQNDHRRPGQGAFLVSLKNVRLRRKDPVTV